MERLKSPFLEKYENSQQINNMSGYETHPALAPARINANSQMTRLPNNTIFHQRPVILLIKPSNTKGTRVKTNSANHPLFRNME